MGVGEEEEIEWRRGDNMSERENTSAGLGPFVAYGPGLLAQITEGEMSFKQSSFQPARLSFET